MYSSITPRRSLASLADCVRTFMPGSQGVVQEAGVPRRPSISTRHRRQEPNGSEVVGGAQLRHLNAGLDRGAHAPMCRRHGDGLAVDLERHQRFGHALGVP